MKESHSTCNNGRYSVLSNFGYLLVAILRFLVGHEYNQRVCHKIRYFLAKLVVSLY